MQLPDGVRIETVMLCDDFTTNTPKTASGCVKRLVTTDGDVLLEAEYGGDGESFEPFELARAAHGAFDREVTDYLLGDALRG